jgi:hypothetical protein
MTVFLGKVLIKFWVLRFLHFYKFSGVRRLSPVVIAANGKFVQFESSYEAYANQTYSYVSVCKRICNIV